LGTYSIKDLENLTGIKAHTIRIWEQRYGILEPKRTSTNVRYYTADDLKSMLNITLLNNNGVKISHIAKMTRDEIREQVADAVGLKNSSYDDQISALTLAMIDIDEPQFERIMSANILRHGFENCMINIVYPFLRRIGALWQTDAINPAQEHFITNLIRQKLIVAIDGKCQSPIQHPESFLLYLPEGELHEISLLFAYYLIRGNGFKVIYLGQSLPMEDLVEVYKIQRPSVIFSVMTSFPPFHEVQEYVDRLGREFPEAHIMLTGHQVLGQGIEAGPNMEMVPSFHYLIDWLKDLGRKRH
jgi:DNA-binding transcriptional MerR regulator